METRVWSAPLSHFPAASISFMELLLHTFFPLRSVPSLRWIQSLRMTLLNHTRIITRCQTWIHTDQKHIKGPTRLMFVGAPVCVKYSEGIHRINCFKMTAGCKWVFVRADERCFPLAGLMNQVFLICGTSGWTCVLGAHLLCCLCNRQLSTEQAVLQESLQKESKVNKRLSMENEELLWKLHNGDLSSPRRTSPTASASASPSHAFSLQSPRSSGVFSSPPLSPR